MATSKQALTVASALCAALLCGCTPSVGVRPSAPLVITRTKYKPIPAELLRPCQKPKPFAPLTPWGDLAQAYKLVTSYLAQCNAQVTAIGKTQETNKP